MEPHRCASAVSDHSESIASSHEQHCSQMPQQMVYNAPSHGHPHHLAANSHMPPQQGHVMPPQQQYITAEPNVHFGQAQAMRSPADYSPVCSALTGEVVHPALTTSVLPNNQPYSEVKSYQRHSSSREPLPVYGNMSESVVTMVSPNALHQNVEGMNVPGHMMGGNRHMTHGAYYRVPYHGQHMHNSGQISWQGQRQCMPPEGHGVVPSQVHVSGVQARFNSQMSVPLRGQHPHYALNQDYRDNVYCQQYPVYSELSCGNTRGTFPAQQRFVGPDGQQMMFARPTSMVAAHRHSRMPVENQFVCYTPHAASAASPHLSPTWSGSTHTMRTGVPVGYSNQPVLQRPLAVAYGSLLPRQHMHAYHISPEPRMNTEHCRNFGGVRQHLSPPQSFTAGSVHCYRPSPNQAVYTGMANVDGKYIGTSCVVPDGNPCGTPASQEYVSPVVSSSNESTAGVCSPVVSDVSSKDTVVMTTNTTTPSHPDGRTSALHSPPVSGMPTSSLSSCTDPGYYVQGTNVNGSWSTSSTGEYYMYNAASQHTQHQPTSRHINPYGYYTPSPHPPYSGMRHYPAHPYQSCTEEMQWQGHAVEHPLHESRHALSDKVANQHQLEEDSSTPVAITASSNSASVTSAVNVLAHMSSKRVGKQNLSDTDTVYSLQSTALNSDYHIPYPAAAYPVTEPSTVCSSASSPAKCCSEVVVTASATPQTLPSSSMDSAHAIEAANVDVSFTMKDIQCVHDKSMNSVVAVAPPSMVSQNASDTTVSSYKSPKGPKRGGTRKATAKTKKKKTNLTIDADKFCSDSAVVTYAGNVNCDAVRSFCSASSVSHASTHQKMMPGLVESADRRCPVTSSCSEQAAVVVPYGWRRHVDNDTVVYYSPSNVCLRSQDEVRQYLLKEGTCKCGLQCPLVVDKTFVFDAQLKQSKHLLPDDIDTASDRSNSLCNHRRKIIAMAAFQQTTGFQFTKPDTAPAPLSPLSLPHQPAAALMTSVGETKSVSTSPENCQVSTGLSIVSVASNASNVSAAAVRDASMQDHISCTGPSASSSADKCRTDPVVHMHYGSAPVHQYRPMILQRPRMTSHPNAAYYHPSTDFQARMSPSYRQMETFAAGQIPCATPGYAAYDRCAVHVAGSSWSGNVPRQRGGVYGLTAQPVSSAADVTPPVSDVQEPVRTAKSKKKSRAQQRESYSSILERSVPCPNIDVRQIIQEQRERLQMEAASCSALGIQSSTAAWTMPTTSLHATSASSSQKMSSQTSTSSSTTLISSISDGRSSSSAVSQFGSTSITVTAYVSGSSTEVTSADGSLRFLPATTSVNVSPAFSCSSSLPYVTTSCVGTNVSDSHVMAVPVLTSVSCAASWVRHPQFGQYMRWSQYSAHPMSCTTVAMSSFGMSPFHCSQGQQVIGVPPYPAVEPRLNDVLAPAAVTMTTCVVASSGWLPSGPSFAAGTVKGESPIRLVQNMVSGLETTQNSLAMATSLIISRSDSVPRRRRSGAADTAVTATNTGCTESCDDMRFNSESLNVSGQTNSSVQLPDEVQHPQSRLSLPCTSAATTVTNVWTQVVPATSIVPSACCSQVLPSPVITYPPVSCDSDAVGLCTDTVCLTATSPASNPESTTVSGGDVDMDSTCHSESTASAAIQPLNDSQVIDDDDSTQDCDISADLGEVLCTTGTQTSTPASAVSNCNSVESGGDGSESNDAGGPIVCAADDVEPPPDTVACSLPASRPSAVCEGKPPDNVHIPVPSSAAVVLIPRVPQASFFLPQNIAFAPNPLVSHGFLQFQPPGEFGYGTGVHSSSGNAVGQPGTLGLVHFAAGPVVGPAVGNMMAASDASGSFRLMTPVKSDSDAYSGAEFLPLMPAAMPAGHILLQNIVPTGLASTIVPIMQPAALCNLPSGSPALFAVSQGSVMSVGAPLAFASVPVPGQPQSAGDHGQDQPDSTVDNSEMEMIDEPSSDDSADTEQVTSTDEPFDEVSNNPATDCTTSVASTLHCTTSHGTDSSLIRTNPCSDHECSNNTSSRTVYDSLRSDETAGGSSARHSAVQRSWSTLKKRTHLGRSRLKKIRCDYGFAASAAVNQTSVTSAPTRDSDMRSLHAMTSPLRGEEFVDSPCFDLETKDAATSDSSVSTTISLHDCTTGSTNVSTVDRSRRHAGSAQKARWKKQALARRTRLPLRHSKHVAKQLVDARLSPSETSVVEDVADSTTGSVLSSSPPRTFNIGDLVWGPSRGFPSWPGKLVAESEVRGNHKSESGKIWVKWFGDHTFTQADPDQLKDLSEGLETHHNARKKDRQGRKMNSNLEAAIQEAMSELDRQMDEQSTVRSSSSAVERSQKTSDGKKRK